MDITDIIFYIAEMIGVIAFSAYGAMAAVERHLDLFGIVILGATTAVGGGVLRDVLLGQTPPIMFTNYEYVLVAVIVAVIVFLIARFKSWALVRNMWRIDRIMNMLDAVGLGIFTVTGVRASITAGYGHKAFLTIFVGVITGVGGGVLRDMMCGMIPMVLCKRIYAVASLAGAIVYYILYKTGNDAAWKVFTSVAIIFIIRILASIYRWSLPIADISEQKEE